MKLKFLKESSKNDFDEYDDIFGEPTTQVWKINDYLNVLDDIIAYTENKPFNKESYFNENYIDENLNKEYNLSVDVIIASTSFETAIKLLHKKHKIDTLKELKEIIIKLGNYEITTQSSNHPLKKFNGHLDIHVNGGKLVLLYRYIDEKKLSVGFTEESINHILKLQDVINHKELSRYNKNKLKNSTTEFDINTLDK